jgi:NADPH:quinone reductase-like Zn-dependent oxidoreductase
MALRFRAAMKTGETVLINGATGFTGKVAIQVAKRYGAKKIIVTGRNERILQSLKELGADETIFLKQDDDALIGQFKGIHEQAPIDIILDYLWGHTAEILLSSLMGNGSFTHPVRFVSVGAMTGDKIQLSAENLRSVDLQITGSGLGSWSKSEISLLFTEMLPEMLQLAAENKIKLETEAIRLSDIEKIWDMEIPDGKRLVVII